MNKGILVFCMLITIVVAIGVLSVMVLGLNGYSVFDFIPDYGIVLGGRDSVLIKEESIPFEDIRRLTVDTSGFSVSVRAVDGDTAVFRQYDDPDSGNIMTVDVTGSEVSLDCKPKNIQVFFAFWLDSRRIELDIPRAWLGDVSLSTSSGGIKLNDQFEWSQVTMNTSSGGITLEKRFEAQSLDMKASSGGITIRGELVVAGRFSARTSSGGIRGENSVSADTVDFSATSGGIRFLDCTITASDFRAESSSGGINLGTVQSGTFDVRATSGGVKIDRLSGRGNLDSSSGGVRVDTLLPNGDTSMRTTSGSLVVGLVERDSFKVDASVTSGSIRSDYQVWYSDDRNKRGVITNGQEPFINISASASSGGITVNRK